MRLLKYQMPRRSAASLAWIPLMVLCTCARPQRGPVVERGSESSAPAPEEEVARAEDVPAPAQTGAEDLPPHEEPSDEIANPRPGGFSPDVEQLDVEGRAIANLSSDECRERIRDLGITVEDVNHAAVETAMRPTGPIGGIEVEFVGRRAVHRIMDCRLILAIHAWSPALRAAGVVRLRHLSALRPGAITRSTGRPSGHSRGMAFDVRHFDFDSERTLDVLTDWTHRTRGAPPCELPPSEPDGSALMRALTCRAIEAEIFQVVVTPHNDDAHANHLHLEVVSGVDWSWAG